MPSLRSFSSIQKRRSFLEKQTNTTVAHIGSYSLDEQVASTKHCENMIGATQVPLGIAGSLAITTHNPQPTTHNYYIPLATTEGALVASVSRGCKAVSDAGGVSVYATHVGTTRAPGFYVPSWEKNIELHAWLQSNIDLLKKTAKSTSQHTTLLDIEHTGSTPYVFLRMKFDTEDAMGMNMATIATEKVVSLIEKEVGIRCISLSGNVDVDKKPSWRNTISRRGWSVGAEVTIPQTILKTVLKTTAQSVYEVWVSKCMVGSAISGSMGFNAHFANILAALFIATGQDVAHVAECSVGMTICEKRGNDLFVSIQIPDLMVGTVGGGTGLSTQKEAVSLVGLEGKVGSGKTEEFAGVVAGAVLAGEISLLASLAEGTLARAHKTLAR